MKKINVLLVDDEEIVLEDLKTLIDWEKNGVQNLYTARNATQAFRVLHKSPIDVIFMDILLPGKDGLVLSREILQEYPGVQIVILSAYNEFSYAKTGIELGVFRYILKHELTEEKLESLLADLKGKLEKEKQRQIMLEEQILYAYILNGKALAGLDRPAASVLETSRLWMGAIVPMQPFTAYLPGYEPVPNMSQMKVSISELMALEQDQAAAKYILSLDDHLLVFAEEAACLLPGFENLLRKMTFHLQQKTRIPLKCLFFSSPVKVGDLKERSAQLAQRIPALVFCSHRVSLPVETSRRDFTDQHSSEDGQRMLRLLSDVIQLRDEKAFFRIAGDIIASGLKDPADAEGFDQIYYAEDIHTVLQEKLQESRERKSREETISPATRFILRYIQENYSENISLQNIAQELNANVMYIGRIFQKDMGVSFRTYLNEYRIHLAEKLLATTNKKIFEISEEIGIPNGQYFSRLFRQQTGDSPNEYRQKHFMIDERNV